MLQLLLIIPIIGSAIIYFIQDTTFKDYKQIIILVALGIFPNLILDLLHTYVYTFLYDFNSVLYTDESVSIVFATGLLVKSNYKIKITTKYLPKTKIIGADIGAFFAMTSTQDKFKNLNNNSFLFFSALNFSALGQESFQSRFGKNLIHTSALLYSDSRSNSELHRIIAESESTLLENESLSNLQVVKYNENFVSEEVKDLITSNSETFSWFYDEDGCINYNKSIRLFEGVKLISHFLETRYGLDKDQISQSKVNEILKIFEDDKGNLKDVTVFQLFQTVSEKFNQNREFFTDRIIENLNSLDKIPNNSAPHPAILLGGRGSGEDISIDPNKPWGKFGETTLHEIRSFLLDFKWTINIDKVELVVHGAPLVMNSIGFGLLLRSYVKYIHNKPLPQSLTGLQKEMHLKIRNRNLILFLLVGAPLTLHSIRSSGNLYKDMFNVNFNLTSSTDLQTDNNISNNNISNNSSFFLLLSNINKKLPDWVKLIFRLLFLSILVLKLLGISIFEFLNSTYYIKMFSYITCSLLIIYQFLNLYLLHKFSNNNIKIPEVLPDFLINWLKDFKIICSNKESINVIKKTYYIEISIYLVILILTTFV